MKLAGIRLYPRQVVIDGNIWGVRFSRCVQNNQNIHGLCCPDERVIYIKKGLGKVETLRVFIHESFHAYEYEYGILIYDEKYTYDPEEDSKEEIAEKEAKIDELHDYLEEVDRIFRAFLIENTVSVFTILTSISGDILRSTIDRILNKKNTPTC